MIRLIVLLVVLVGFGLSCASATPQMMSVEERIRYHCELLVKYQAPYVWGGYWGPITGGDCSGLAFWSYRRSGVGVKRETAFGMWLGRGGWGINNYAGITNAQFPNTIYFSYKKQADHVGIVDQLPSFYEASSSAKHFKKTILGNRIKSILGYKITPLVPGR